MQKIKRLQWDSKFSVGFDALDEQHKKLFEIINKAMGAYETQSNDLIDIFTELSDYLGYHFMSEENTMAAMRYPGREQHHLKHQEFIKQFMGFLDDYELGKDKIALNLLIFLRDWLFKHVLKNEDPGYAMFYKESLKSGTNL